MAVPVPLCPLRPIPIPLRNPLSPPPVRRFRLPAPHLFRISSSRTRTARSPEPTRRGTKAKAKSGDGDGGRLEAEEKSEPVDGEEALGKERRRDAGLEFRWRDLLDPDPENLLAVGLTGLLALASVQALWQLFFISVAILLAALKYSFIAALLIFIVITLL